MISGPRVTQPLPVAEHPKGEAWHHRSAEEVLTQLGSSATGLSRRKQYNASRRTARMS